MLKNMSKNTRLYYSISSAAKHSGISKSIISAAVKSKELRSKRTPKGKGKNSSVEIDKTDFAIWEKEYNETRRQGTNAQKNGQEELKRTAENDPKNVIKTKELEFDVKYKTQRIKDLENRVVELETERNDWKGQATTLLLTHQPKAQEPELSIEKPHINVLSAVLFGAGGFVLLAVLLVFGVIFEPQIAELLRF